MLSNFAGYAEDAYWGNLSLVAEAHASGRTRESIVAEAMTLQPCPGVYATRADDFGCPDWGLAMAWHALKGSRMGLFAHAVRAKHSGDWSDVISMYGETRLDDIRNWMAADDAYLAVGYSDRRGNVTPEYLAYVAASDKVKDLFHKSQSRPGCPRPGASSLWSKHVR